MVSFLVVVLPLLSALERAEPSFRADSCYFPAWSPDGRAIAFEARVDGKWRIATIGADGSSLRVLTDGASNSRSPTWSTDGNRLAVVSDREGDWDLYVIGKDGSNPARLTRDPFRESAPAWSPDGARIAFVWEGEGRRELRAIDPEGARISTLQTDGPPLAWRLTWSHDGERLAWFSPERPAEDGSPTRLAVLMVGASPRAMSAATSADEGRRDFNPSWSPDEWIVFDAHERGGWDSDDGGWEIWAMREDGSSRKRLTENRVNDWGPDVSLDGRFIAFSSGMNDRYEIWIMNRDGSERRRLTHVVYEGAAPGEERH